MPSVSFIWIDHVRDRTMHIQTMRWPTRAWSATTQCIQPSSAKSRILRAVVDNGSAAQDLDVIHLPQVHAAKEVRTRRPAGPTADEGWMHKQDWHCVVASRTPARMR